MAPHAPLLLPYKEGECFGGLSVRAGLAVLGERQARPPPPCLSSRRLHHETSSHSRTSESSTHGQSPQFPSAPVLHACDPCKSVRGAAFCAEVGLWRHSAVAFPQSHERTAPWWESAWPGQAAHPAGSCTYSLTSQLPTTLASAQRPQERQRHRRGSVLRSCMFSGFLYESHSPGVSLCLSFEAFPSSLAAYEHTHQPYRPTH